ncbi:MAG: hypothetical protein ACREIV_17200, partial [Planctomycetaceae bacterium]
RKEAKIPQRSEGLIKTNRLRNGKAITGRMRLFTQKSPLPFAMPLPLCVFAAKIRDRDGDVLTEMN